MVLVLSMPVPGKQLMLYLEEELLSVVVRGLVSSAVLGNNDTFRHIQLRVIVDVQC